MKTPLMSQSVPAAVTLRPYRRSDLQAIVELDRICFFPPFRFSKQSMSEFVQARNAISLVACGDGTTRVIGFVIIHLAAHSDGIHGYVVTLDVNPAYTGCRIGSKLLDRGERDAARAGATRMDLHVHTENTGAIAFYDKQHYQPENRLESFYGLGRDAFSYSKSLERPDTL